MEIKKLANNSLNFIIRRFIDLFGITICIFGLLIFISLLSYSPDDPNFIFPKNTEIKNILGFGGSFVSDLFLQSIGFVSIIFSISLFFTGTNIIKSKKVIFLIQNLFYII